MPREVGGKVTVVMFGYLEYATYYCLQVGVLSLCLETFSSQDVREEGGSFQDSFILYEPNHSSLLVYSSFC